MGAGAVQAGALSPVGPGPEPAAPWRFVGLPDQKLPKTRFSVAEVDGRRALRIESAGSYGNLVHPLDGEGGTQLRWSWRVDRALPAADLRSKAGDDTALKVCAMYDLPLEALPFWERQKMRLARGVSGEALPAATLCYVWDPALPAGTVLPNAYTGRLRWMVLRGTGSATGAWQTEQRDLRADFLRVFGDDAKTVPPLTALVIGADADNTGGQALGFLADLVLTP